MDEGLRRSVERAVGLENASIKVLMKHAADKIRMLQKENEVLRGTHRLEGDADIDIEKFILLVSDKGMKMAEEEDGREQLETLRRQNTLLKRKLKKYREIAHRQNVWISGGQSTRNTRECRYEKK